MNGSLALAGRSSRLIAALLVANALNIAADLLAIGSGMDLLGLGPASVWAVIAGATIIALLIGGSFTRISTVFKVLTLSLLAYIPVVFSLRRFVGRCGQESRRSSPARVEGVRPPSCRGPFVVAADG